MKAFLKEFLETVILAALFFLLARASLQNYRVEGSSMEPNFHNGEYLLANKLVYLNLDEPTLKRFLPFLNPDGSGRFFPFHPPQRGDVIVFRFPRDQSRNFIKRVVGVPGDWVEIKDDRVYVNGLRLEEPYVRLVRIPDMPPERVPVESYFVLGDNRNGSNDSREWGTVPLDLVVGKAWLSYWPLDKWGLVPNYSIEAGAN